MKKRVVDYPSGNLRRLLKVFLLLLLFGQLGAATAVAENTEALSGLQLTLVGENGNCEVNDGEASVAVTGGIAPYTYLWNTGDATATISGLASGTYQVTVTDQTMCTAVASITLETNLWHQTAGRSGSVKEAGRDVLTDPNGNVYITGLKRALTQFQGVQSGPEDGFLARYNPCGELVWIIDIPQGEGWAIGFTTESFSTSNWRVFVGGGGNGGAYLNIYDFPIDNVPSTGNTAILSNSYNMPTSNPSKKAICRAIANDNNVLFLAGTFQGDISFPYPSGHPISFNGGQSSGIIAGFTAVLDVTVNPGTEWRDASFVGVSIASNQLVLLDGIDIEMDPVNLDYDVYVSGRFRGAYDVGSNAITIPQTFPGSTQGLAIKFQFDPLLGLGPVTHQRHSTSYLFDVIKRPAPYDDVIVSAFDELMALDKNTLTPLCSYSAGSNREQFTKLSRTIDVENVAVTGSFLLGGPQKEEYAIMRMVKFPAGCAGTSLIAFADAYQGATGQLTKNRGWGIASAGDKLYVTGFFQKNIYLGNQVFASADPSQDIFLARLQVGMNGYEFSKKGQDQPHAFVGEQLGAMAVVAPNPTSGFVRLTLEGNWKNGLVQLSLQGVNGQLIKLASIVQPSLGTAEVVDLPENLEGMYFLVIEQGEQRVTKKLILQ